MAVIPGRFEVEDGEIIDTKARQIISLDQLAKIASPEEQASIQQQINQSEWAGSDQSLEAEPTITARATPSPSITNEPVQEARAPSTRPSLDEFMQTMKSRAPQASDKELRRYWAQNYSDIDPRTLPAFEVFAKTMKERAPNAPERQIRAYWEENYGDFGAAEKEAGDVGRGFSTAFKQIPQLGYGVAAGIGAAGESMLGEGGISTKLKEWGVAGYLEKSKQIYDQSKPSDDFTYSWDQAKQGNFGALVDWMQYGLGYMGAQGAQMLATAGAGSLAGRLAQGPVSTMAAGLVAKEAARIKATQAGSALAAEELGKLATANVASRIGQTTALAAAATGMEGGEIFGDLSAESVKSGQALSGEQLAKAFGATLAAGGLEFVGDKLGLDLMLGKTLAGKIGGRAARVGAGAAAGAAVEGGTEVGQTLIEEYGKGHDPFSPESMREAVNAGALGALGGTVLGGAGGIVKRAEEPPAAVPIESIPEQIGVGNPTVSIDQAIKTATGLLSAPVSSTRPQEDALSTKLAQLSATTSAQREADRLESERQLRDGERLPTAQEAAANVGALPRTGQDIPILEGAQSAPSTLPIAEPSRLWMDEAVVPGIEPGQAFTPRAEPEPDATERLAEERAKLVAMQERSKASTTDESAILATNQNLTQDDTPLQSAADLAYPPSERGRMLTQAELALRDRMASKRPAQQVPLIEGAQPSQASTIVQGSTFVPRQEPELTAKERIAAEREKLVRMKATRPAPKPSESTVPPSSPSSDAPLRTALDRAYPSVAELHDLASEKGFDVESDVFKTLTKMSTGTSHLDELSPSARDRFAETLKRITPAKTPEIVESPTKKALAPVKPTEPSSDAVSAPRSALPPEQNAEMLLRAEKASADLDASSQMSDESLIDFLKSKGGLQDQGGELSAMEVDAQRKAFSKKLIQEKGLTLDQAAELAHEAGHIPERDIALLLDGIDKEVRGKGQHADWYRELTTGPKPMTRQAIDTAVAKIIEDHGVDTGKAVERVKAALLNDREFDGTQWGEDAAAIARGDWPAWIQKPDAPSQSGSVQTSEPVSASPPTEGTTTTPPQTEAATDTPIDTEAHEAASSPQNDRPEPTEAQKEAGNYRKGHLKISGLDISVENPQGSTRSGTDTNGKPWSVTMQSHYGYFRGADFKGKDKEHIDVFVKPGTPEDYSGPVFVIDQKYPKTGRFDEHKTILGASSADEARAIYQANYAKDWKGFRSIKQFTMPEFKLWLKAGNKQKPAGMARPEKKSAGPSFSLTAQAVTPEKPKTENKQTSIDVPPETVGSRPIIGREATPEEAPLFSKAAQEPEAEQTDLIQPKPRRADSLDPSPEEMRILSATLPIAYQYAPTITGTQHLVADSAEVTPPGFLARLSQRAYLKRLGVLFADLSAEMQRALGIEDRAVFAGFDLNMRYAGLNIEGSVFDDAEDGPRRIVINPYGDISDVDFEMSQGRWSDTTRSHRVAEAMLSTLLHEITHQHVKGHGADFEARMDLHEATLGDKMAELQQRIIDFLEDATHAERPIIDQLSRDNRERETAVRRRIQAVREAEAGPDGGNRWTDVPRREDSRTRVRRGEIIPSRRRDRAGQDAAERSADVAPSDMGRDQRGERADTSTPERVSRNSDVDSGLTYDDLNSQNFSGIPAQQQQAALTYHLPAMSKMDTVIRSIQDKNIDLVRLVDSIKKAGASIPDELNPVLREELYMGRVTASTQGFLNGELRPLVDAMRLNKVTLEQLDTYLHARHAKEANAHLKEINPDREDNDALSGMTDAEADRILAAADRPKMDRLAAKVDAILGKTRQMLVDYGLESQDTVDGWAKDYQYYVPLYREGYEEGSPGTGQGRSVRGSHSKARTGSSLSVTNILANVAMDRERAIVRGEKMRPVIALAGLLQQYPNKDVATLAKPSQITYTNPDTGLQEVAAGDIGEYRVPRIKGLNKKTGMVEWRPDPLYKGRDNVVNFRIKGQDHAIIFNEENDRAVEMAKSLKDLDVGRLNGLLAAIAPATRYLSSISTQYNPVFGVVNFVRDIQFAMLSLSSTPLAHKRADIFRGTFRALKGIYADARAQRRGESVNSEMSKLWERFQKVGGPTGYREMFRGSNDRAKAIEHMLNPDWWQQTLGGKILTANGHLSSMQSLILNKAAKPLFEWLSDYNQTMENAVRLATFKAGLDSGMTDEQAASTAKNLTVNFNKKGSVTTQVGALYAFFNASVQGTARIAETLFEKDRLGYLSTTGKKIVAGGIALGAMQAVGLMMAGFGEDEPPEFVRARSLIMPMPGTEKGYLAIPMPLGFNILPNFGRLVAESLIHGKPMDRAYTFMANLVDTFSPVGGAGSVSQFLAPSVADPLVALSENKDWAGRKISKEDFNSMKPTPGHTRAKDSSTPWARGLSEAINYATGGTNYVPGKFSPTPDAIDYLIGSLTGGVGRELAHTAQSVTGLTTGEDVPLHKVPLVGRFVGDAAGPSAVRNEFYENLSDVHRAYEEVHGRQLHHEDATDFLSEHPEARLEKAATHLQREISQLTKRKREMVANGENRERVRLLEMQIAARMQRFNDRVKELQETR